MSTLLEQYDHALTGFDSRVSLIGDDQWSSPTPCTEWDVRALVGAHGGRVPLGALPARAAAAPAPPATGSPADPSATTRRAPGSESAAARAALAADGASSTTASPCRPARSVPGTTCGS